RRACRAADASGRQALELPAALVARPVAKTVVQPVVAVLPELERFRSQAKPAPGLRQRQLGLRVARRDFRDAVLEPLAVRNRAALRRGERAQLTEPWPAAHVLRRLLRADSLDRAFDPDLAPEPIPVKQQSRARVGGELAALAALVVGEEHEPV